MIKIGAKAVRQARSIILQLAEVAVPRELWPQMTDDNRWSWGKGPVAMINVSPPALATKGAPVAPRSVTPYFGQNDDVCRHVISDITKHT